MTRENFKKQIIYIASDQRSGSTLLDMLLNTDPKSISVGEMKYLDDFINKRDKALKFNNRCTCGKQFENCEFWKKVLERVNPDRNSYLNNTKYIYDAIFDLYSPTCIIDSSKKEVFLEKIDQENSNVKVIYLLRDGRGVANSKRRRNNIDIALASYFWVRNNLRIKGTLKHIEEERKLFITYEELCNKTEEVIDKLQVFTGLDNIDAQKIGRIRKHNLAGSPHRFEKKIVIKEDLKWQESFNYLDYIKFILIGGIFNKYNGYRLF